VPEELVDPSVRHARLIGEGLPRIGYLAITSFSRKTPDEFDAALVALGELDALVIDVRGNPGGVLEAAVLIANRFVAQGMLVSHEGRGAVVEFQARPEEATRAGLPLAVLVDGDSASASEVFAAALQDHRAAVLVGTATYGKGVVQEVRHFDQGRAVVKLTTAYYYTPAGRNLERTVESAWDSGIQPDLWVELAEDEALAVAQHLASHAAPPAALPRLRAWEQELGVQLVPSHPPDRQLEAALALFRADRPGAWTVDAADEALLDREQGE
jgi:C-terminal peptidase prc